MPAVLVALLIPATALAAVDVNAIEPSTVNCGKSIRMGIWAQPGSPGPNWAKMWIKNQSGKIVWRKNATATSNGWTYWSYKGACGEKYTAYYESALGTTKFPFKVR